MVWWLRSVSVAAALVLTAVLLRRWLLALVAVIGGLVVAIGVLVASAYVAGQWRRARAVRLFRAVWETRGKDLLLVCSNGPHRQRHVEETWLARWGHRAVLLNWSDRRKWDPWAAAAPNLF
jgi:hypothetical protein